ncbi:UPF0744 protein, partial [Lachnellula arida]
QQGLSPEDWTLALDGKARQASPLQPPEQNIHHSSTTITTSSSISLSLSIARHVFRRPSLPRRALLSPPRHQALLVQRRRLRRQAAEPRLQRHPRASRQPPRPRALETASAAASKALARPGFNPLQHPELVLRNKLLATVLVIAAGGASYYVIKGSTSRRKKRRAKRAGTGARLEVVVLAGSPSEPMTRSIALDLERRGFIVYIVCNTIEEEVLVQNESRPDIKPLMIDIVDTQRAKQAIERFTAYLQHPHTPLPGTRPHHLTFRSLLLIPSTTYPSAPIAAFS